MESKALVGGRGAPEGKLGQPEHPETGSDQASIALRPARVEDAPAVWRMVNASTLDTNSPYAYLMWFRDFSGTSVLAEQDGRPVGFLAGYEPPGRPGTRFVWQVCVDPSMRGRGLAHAMLAHFARGEGTPVRYIEATVTPGNAASLALFRGFAAQAGVPCEEAPCFAAELFPGEAHEPEHLLRIGPLPSGKDA